MKYKKNPYFIGIFCSFVVVLFTAGAVHIHQESIDRANRALWRALLPDHPSQEEKLAGRDMMLRHAEATTLTVNTLVRKKGEVFFRETAVVSPGDTVQWLVEVVNGSESRQSDVVASVLSPTHMSLVPGSAEWYNSSHPDGIPYDFDTFDVANGAGGIVFGNYAPKGGAFLVRFDSFVGAGFPGCSVVVRNTAHTKSEQLPNELSDSADVTINKDQCS